MFFANTTTQPRLERGVYYRKRKMGGKAEGWIKRGIKEKKETFRQLSRGDTVAE